MKLSLTRLLIIAAVLGLAPSVFRSQEIGHKNFRTGRRAVMETWVSGEESTGSPRDAKGFVPAYGQAPAAEKPQPLTQDQILELIAGGVTNQRAEELIKTRGIDFEVNDDYVRSLRKAGANEQLVTLLRKYSVPMEGITVETEPAAQVFLDGNLQGQADDRGVLVVRSKIGVHTLKVTLAGRRDFEQSVTVVDGRPSSVVAQLASVAGSIRVKALAGAAVWLDSSIRGTVDASGQLLIAGISPGPHDLRVTAQGKVDDARSITVAGGAETPVQVALADGVRVNPQDGLKYVWIAPGNFMMGCSPGDNGCAAPEKPAHRVNFSKPFWIGQTEVTVAAYKRFVAAANAKMPPVSPKIDRGWKNGNLPIVDVTWAEADQYCNWIGGKLPTEAEWEYAARGGSLLPRYGDLSTIAWSKENAGNQTHEVAAKTPNAFGLFDTLGNVWEWISDWYDPNYYQTSPNQNPAGPATGSEKVLRGGSWIVDSTLLRVSDRYSIQPGARSDFFGFRCVWKPQTR